MKKPKTIFFYASDIQSVYQSTDGACVKFRQKHYLNKGDSIVFANTTNYNKEFKILFVDDFNICLGCQYFAEMDTSAWTACAILNN